MFSILLVNTLILFPKLTGPDLYEVKKGSIHFASAAPQEKIEATSAALKGLLNVDDNAFAFTAEIQTFEGFNSGLQREHFNENYMESRIYPKAIFTGKLIDKFNPESASQKVRAKGQLDIHGIKKERIIDVTLEKKANTYSFTSAFNVALIDHGITMPKIVFQKIAETISVDVSGELARK